MERFVHRPLRVDAVRWDGDLEPVRALITGDSEAERDSRSAVLWVTERRWDALSVFPVALNHWLVRTEDGRLLGMSPREFEATYAIVAA